MRPGKSSSDRQKAFCSTRGIATAFVLALIVLASRAWKTIAAEPAPRTKNSIEKLLDEFARGLEDGMNRRAPALFPPLHASVSFAIRAAMPIASEESQEILKPLLYSAHYYNSVAGGPIIDEAVTGIEQQLQEENPRATIRPRHISIHALVNLGAEAGTNTVAKPERDVSYLVIRAHEFDDPLKSVARHWEILLPGTTDEDALLSLFADRDAVRRLLEYQVSQSDEGPDSAWAFSEPVTTTFVFDVFELPAFAEQIAAAESIESANEMVVEWLADHPVRLEATLVYEIMNESDTQLLDVDAVTIETIRRQFEFDGKHWKLLEGE